MKNVQTGTETVFHEAKGHEEKAIVQEAYDETIPQVTQTACSFCS